MIPFPFNENKFSLFVADHLLVGQLCTNPTSNWSLLSCLKVDTVFNERDRRCTTVQLMVSTNPSYDNKTIASTLKMQIQTVQRLRAQLNASDDPLEAAEWKPKAEDTAWQTRTKEYIEKVQTIIDETLQQCGDPLVQSGSRWQTLCVAAWLGAGPQVQRDPGLASEGVLRLGTLLSLPTSSSDLNQLDYFVWSYVENITNMTSHNTKDSLVAPIRRVFAELPPALVKKACSQFRIRIAAVIEAEGGYIE